jgi:hypothetical protein
VRAGHQQEIWHLFSEPKSMDQFALVRTILGPKQLLGLPKEVIEFAYIVGGFRL